MSQIDIQDEVVRKYAEAKLEWNRVMKRESTIAELGQARMKLDANAQALADAALAAWKILR